MRMPRPRRPHRASPDEVRITRDGDYAIIAYADDAVATTHFKIGSERLAQMTDEQIIDLWNDGIDARDRFMAAQELVAVLALLIGVLTERFLAYGLSFDALLTLRHAIFGDRHPAETPQVVVVNIDEDTFTSPGFLDVPFTISLNTATARV